MCNCTYINLNYRPTTYWPESENLEQRLTHIQGKARRDITRNAPGSGGIRELNRIGPQIALGDLSNELRSGWVSMHPSLMGGEYLPQYAENEVEIARISLKSTTSDQISIRAFGRDGDIRYRVVDQYESEYQLSIEGSHVPLSLSRLISLLEETSHPFDEAGSGLIRCHWESNQSFSSPEEAVDFVSIESAFYPDLCKYYSEEAIQWVTEQRIDDEDRSENPDPSHFRLATEEDLPRMSRAFSLPSSLAAREIKHRFMCV